MTEENFNGKVKELEKQAEALDGGIKAVPTLAEEAKKMRANFARQLEQCSKAIEQNKKQNEMLNTQMEQIKGALFALDTLTASVSTPKKED